MTEMIKVTIETITCHKRSDFIGEDQIYLKQHGQNEQLWPQGNQVENIKVGETLEPYHNHYYQPNETVTLELWEYDQGVGNDDFLGSITLDSSSSGKYTHYMSGDGGSYEVRYYVENPQVPNESQTTKAIKRLIVCCDGTWQSLEKDYPTNVVKTVKSIIPIDSQGIHQVVYYDEGIGSQSNISKEEDLTKAGLGHLQSKVEAIAGGAFGMGIDKNIKDAYRFLSTNYHPGDEIYLFGFSRGSYTVRSLAGMLSQCGLLKREHLNKIHDTYELYRNKTESESTKMEKLRSFCQPNEDYDDRVPITLLACYDTVGSLGIPNIFDNIHIDELINSRYAFHDTKLSKIIKNALHAVAVDEDRDTFSVTLMKKNPEAKDQVLRQVWFPGGHGCVGGGTKRESLLSNNTLLWMIASIKDIGLNLEFDINLLSDDERLEGEYDGDQLTDATFDYNKQAGKQVGEEITDQIKGGADQFKWLIGGLISTIKEAAINAAGKTLREIPPDDGIHRSVFERIHYSNLDYHPKNVSSERILSREQLESDDSILLTSE